MRHLRRWRPAKLIFSLWVLVILPQGMTASNDGADAFYPTAPGPVAKFPFSYPNPFGLLADCRNTVGGVCFAFEPSVVGDVTLRIFDVSGSLVRRISYTAQTTADGVPDRIHWDGNTTGGYQVANGVYLYRIELKAVAGGNQTFSGRCYKFSYP